MALPWLTIICWCNPGEYYGASLLNYPCCNPGVYYGTSLLNYLCCNPWVDYGVSLLNYPSCNPGEYYGASLLNYPWLLQSRSRLWCFLDYVELSLLQSQSRLWCFLVELSLLNYPCCNPEVDYVVHKIDSWIPNQTKYTIILGNKKKE